METPRTKTSDPVITESALLTASLTEAVVFSFDDVIERIETQTEGNESAGRRWIVAVQRARAAGHITEAQALTLMVVIGDNVWRAAEDRDPQLMELGAQIDLVLEAQKKAKRRGARGKDKLARVSDEYRALNTRRLARLDALRNAWLSTLGEPDIERRLTAEGIPLFDFRRAALTPLFSSEERDPNSWRVSYPSPERPILEPSVVFEIEPGDWNKRVPRGDARVFENVEKRDDGARDEGNEGDEGDEEDTDDDDDDAHEDWRDADGTKDGVGTGELDDASQDFESLIIQRMARLRHAIRAGRSGKLQNLLDFSALCAPDEGRMGEVWMESILRSRAIGVIPTELSYFLLDYVCWSLIDDTDSILEAIEERMGYHVARDSGWNPGEHPDLPRKEVELWQELHRAYLRREDVLIAKLLRARGEDEQADQMLDHSDEYRARLEAVAEEWALEPHR